MGWLDGRARNSIRERIESEHTGKTATMARMVIILALCHNFDKSSASNMQLFLVGIIFIMAAYHFALYILRPRDRSPAYFGAFCCSIIMLQLMSSYPYNLHDKGLNNIASWLISNFGIVPPSFLWSISIAGSGVFMLQFLTSRLDGYYPKRLHALSWVLLGVIALFSVLHQVSLYMDPHCFTLPNVFSLGINGTVLTISLLILYVLISAVRQRQENALIMMLGFFVLFVTIFIDVLSASGVLEIGKIIAFGTMFFIFSHAVVIARGFSNAHTDVENLSARLLSLDKLKDDFLANTSHELRTPVHGIIGLSESLVDGAAGALPKKAVETLSVISSSGRRLTTLVNDILDFSKLKNQDITLQKKHVDLRQLAGVVTTVLRTTLADKRLVLINNVPPTVPYVYGDENRLEQVMYNLVGNAVKFTPTGQVSISARAAGSGFVEVSVEDTGVGIPADRLGDIFEWFEQVDGSMSREFGGTGLGLSITKQLVELHGGVISVESDPGKGSRFVFTVPEYKGATEIPDDRPGSVFSEKAVILSPSAATPQVSEQDANPAWPDGSDPASILVVDDETANKLLIANQLSLHNYRADIACNGMEALRMIGNNTYDLVLLDIMMPKMSGYDVCREIRKKYSLHELPVLMLTARSRASDILAGFEAGANDYMTKPFGKAELLARARTLLSLKKAVKTALDNARLANIDGLTELANRRHLFSQAKKQFDIAKRYHRSLSLMMMDIDEFKKLNDTYGHDTGDNMIQLVARTISSQARATDIVGRYGGEEFAVVMPEASHGEAGIMAERIRKAVRDQRLVLGEDQRLGCTISIGYAECDNTMESVDDLFRKADKFMYMAKQSGRNRVEGQGMAILF